MPRRVKPLPFPLESGPFRFSEAAAARVPRSRLRATDLQRPHRGLYVPLTRGELAVEERCEHLVPLLAGEAWFSHLTAARLWGMPLPFAWTQAEPLHVMALAGTAPVRRVGVVGWETADAAAPRQMLGLIPVIAPADVWCQLAVPGATGTEPETARKQNLSREWLVAVGDYLLTGPKLDGTRRPLCTLEDLAEAVRRHRGKRGAKALAWAIERVRTPVHSPQETRLRLRLVDHGLPEAEVQFPVLTSMGWRHADLGYRDARVLLEYQGDHHRTDRAQWREDLTRIQLFEDAGYRTIAVTQDDLAPDFGPLATRVRRALAGRRFGE